MTNPRAAFIAHLREAHGAAKDFATWLATADPLEIADDEKYWAKRDAITVALDKIAEAHVDALHDNSCPLIALAHARGESDRGEHAKCRQSIREEARR